jgi:selenocysteine lyase/cysteine desulfurase
MKQILEVDTAAAGAAGPAVDGPLRAASWDQVRSLFPLDERTIHMNTGTVGAVPLPVLEVYHEVTRAWSGSLGNVYPPSLYADYRAAIAKDFGVDQDELVISHNATESTSRIIAGLELGEGDEAITTSHECFSVLSNLNLIANRHGLRVRKLTLPSGPAVSTEEIIDLFESGITPRTKVMAFAAVNLFTGTLMPTRKLCDLAQRHGITTVIDGALLPGMLNCDLRALGPDFVAGSGSKWQCGPLGTGLLYVRNKVIPEWNPLPLPAFWPVISTWYPVEGAQPPRSCSPSETCNMGDYLQSAGSASVGRAAALARACELWNSIGRDRIEQYILDLGRYAKERVAERFGEGSMYSPLRDERLHAPMVAFNPFRTAGSECDGKSFDRLVERLEKEHDIWTRWVEFDVPGSVHMHYGIRLCTHLYNNREEIDRVLSVTARLAEEIR